MSSAQPTDFRRRATGESDIDRVLLHIRGLVLVRALLEARGASAAEIAEHSGELERQRERLAEVVQLHTTNGGGTHARGLNEASH